MVLMKRGKPKPKDPGAVRLGRKGGLARLRTMSPEQRSEIARQAANARWGKKQTGGKLAPKKGE
jgi:hypothetical protein